MFDPEDHYTGYGNNWRYGPPPNTKTAWASRIHDAMYAFIERQHNPHDPRYSRWADAWHADAVANDPLGASAIVVWTTKHTGYYKRDTSMERRFTNWVFKQRGAYIFTMSALNSVHFSKRQVMQNVFGSSPHSLGVVRKEPIDPFDPIWPPFKYPKPNEPWKPVPPRPVFPDWPTHDPVPDLPPNIPEPVAPPPPENPYPAPDAAHPHYGHRGIVRFTSIKI